MLIVRQWTRLDCFIDRGELPGWLEREARFSSWFISQMICPRFSFFRCYLGSDRQRRPMITARSPFFLARENNNVSKRSNIFVPGDQSIENRPTHVLLQGDPFDTRESVHLLYIMVVKLIFVRVIDIVNKRQKKKQIPTANNVVDDKEDKQNCTFSDENVVYLAGFSRQYAILLRGLVLWNLICVWYKWDNE